MLLVEACTVVFGGLGEAFEPGPLPFQGPDPNTQRPARPISCAAVHAKFAKTLSIRSNSLSLL